MASKPSRARFRAPLAALLMLIALLLPTAAFAQASPSPSGADDKKGLCAPWHHCVALGVTGLVGLYTLFLLGMYAYQARGFDKVEHKMGNPQGVPRRQ